MRKTSVRLNWASLVALAVCACLVPACAQQAPQVGDVQPLLSNLDDVVTSTRVSLAKLRIEKWKVQSEVKLEEKLHAEPQSLAANFAMYRNLDAVHDVLNLLTQTAGAVAPDDEFSALASNAGRLDELRRAFADRMENLSASKDAELAQLQGLGSAGRKTEAAPPPKKIIIDDMAPAKKPTPTKRKSR
jgi:hypothetical protein